MKKYSYPLLFISLLVSANFAFGLEASALITKMQLALDKNQPEEVEELFENNESTLMSQVEAHEKLAISYERRNKFKEAAEVYRTIITNFNRENHQKIIAAKGVTVVDSSLYQNTKLPFYYYKLAFLNALMFRSSNKYIPIEERKKILVNTQGFLVLCKRVKVDEADIKTIEELIKEKIKFETELTFKSKYYVFFNVISWQDRVYLINQTTKSETKLLSTALGSSIGFGKKWENIKYEFNVEGMFSFAKATTSSESLTTTYSQSSVGVKAITVGPGFYTKTFSDKVYIGLHMPISYRIGDWTLPSGNYSLRDQNLFGVGYFIQTKFYINNFALQTRLGKIFPNPGSHWSIGGLYDF